MNQPKFKVGDKFKPKTFYNTELTVESIIFDPFTKKNKLISGMFDFDEDECLDCNNVVRVDFKNRKVL